MNQQAAASQKTRAEQETENEANRLREQVDAALAIVALRSSDEVDSLQTAADRIERAARDLADAIRPNRRTARGGRRVIATRSRFPLLIGDDLMASTRTESTTKHLGRKHTAFELDNYGIVAPARVYWNLNTPELYEEIARRNEGVLSNYGNMIVDTGEHTGRAAKDKAIVREAGSEDKVFWGDVNKDFPQEKFNAIKDRMMAHATGRDLFVQDTFVGADQNYRLPIRVINELAWHSLFARTMFISNTKETAPHHPEFTIINFPSFQADPQRDGTRSPTFILMDFSQRLVLIGGTSYAGETKKSAFTIMNYLLPQRGVMSMHCSANVGSDGDVAIFFGLSGTGKTTLSADPERRLIGDDEHGWS
jgi:phosphoenolpyruvate carboxykinase (ATP)